MPEPLLRLDGRHAGVLLHPTSLPGPEAHGTLGADARRFVDWLADSGFALWQVLPLGPVDTHGSPYQLQSAFAGNRQLIDPPLVAAEDWWPASEPLPAGPALVPAAWERFRHHASDEAQAEFHDFRAAEAGWLMPYALFRLFSARFDARPWWEWPAEAREHRHDALGAAMHAHAHELTHTMFGQYLFHRQWHALREYAHARGVALFGDLPFYVDRNSADVWWQPRNFRLDEAGTPTWVAGVPPDYFNADGQLWGNPVYDWDWMAEQGFDWWLARLRHQSRWFDLLRLDHFRALESCWVVRFGASHARDGHWDPVPGDALLSEVRTQLPGLALVAEDLGTITPAVTELRDRHHLPGMLVLQFGFDGSPDNPYLPENHVANAVVYTGTHDNDTTLGWYQGLPDHARIIVNEKLGGDPRMPDALVQAAYDSPAMLAVLPLQDLMGLDSRARMNTPGTIHGNWQWRFRWEDLESGLAARCRQRAEASGRLAKSGVVQESLV